jgi:hypothetical protein
VSDPMTAPTGSPMSAAREREIRDALAHGFWPPTGVIAVVEELLWELDRLRGDAARDAALLENCRVALRSIGSVYYHVDTAAERAKRRGDERTADALEHVYGRIRWLDHALGTMAERVAARTPTGGQETNG